MALDYPGILVMGPRRSGKSSILKVIYARMPSHETVFLTPTTGSPRVYTCAKNPYFQYNIWDWPGEHEFSKSQNSSNNNPYQGRRTLSGRFSAFPELDKPLNVLTFNDAADDPLASSMNPADEDMAVQSLLDQGLCSFDTVTELDALMRCSAIVFVVDSHEEAFVNALNSLRDLAAALRSLLLAKASSSTEDEIHLPALHIFLHKVDGNMFSIGGAEARSELVREAGTLIASELSDCGFTITPGGSTAISRRAALQSSSSTSSPNISLNDDLSVLTLSVSFHLTSIHDHSLLEALSRVCQRVAPRPTILPQLEALCTSLQGSLSAEKVFLLDSITRLYLSTDATPLQGSLYELSADVLDVCLDVALIYDPLCSLQAAGDDPAAEIVARAEQASVASDVGRCSVGFVRLSDGTALYVRELAPFLVVLCVLRMEHPPIESLPHPQGPSHVQGSLHSHSLSHQVSNGSQNPTRTAQGLSLEDIRPGYPLPRSALSVPKRPEIEHNIGVFAKSLKMLFELTDT